MSDRIDRTERRYYTYLGYSVIHDRIDKTDIHEEKPLFPHAPHHLFEADSGSQTQPGPDSLLSTCGQQPSCITLTHIFQSCDSVGFSAKYHTMYWGVLCFHLSKYQKETITDV